MLKSRKILSHITLLFCNHQFLTVDVDLTLAFFSSSLQQHIAVSQKIFSKNYT